MKLELQHQFMLCAVVAFPAVHCSHHEHAEPPPNIVFILADDMGVADVSPTETKTQIPANNHVARLQSPI